MTSCALYYYIPTLSADHWLNLRQHGRLGRRLVANVHDRVAHAHDHELLLGGNVRFLLQETPDLKCTGQRARLLLQIEQEEASSVASPRRRCEIAVVIAAVLAERQRRGTIARGAANELGVQLPRAAHLALVRRHLAQCFPRLNCAAALNLQRLKAVRRAPLAPVHLVCRSSRGWVARIELGVAGILDGLAVIQVAPAGVCDVVDAGALDIGVSEHVDAGSSER